MSSANTKPGLSKRQRRIQWAQQFARIAVVIFCLGGFCYQALEFLMLYWTYPTVVDIQQTSPSYIDIPAFTICNAIGYNFSAICNAYNHKEAVCIKDADVKTASKFICEEFEEICKDGEIPPDFVSITYPKFLRSVPYLDAKDHSKLREPLEDYMDCSIEFAGSKKDCNLENVLGSFYTEEDLPQYCYTIYSLWGQPDLKREKIDKGAVMKFNFYLNASRRHFDKITENTNWTPKYSTPTSPYVQIAVHSPHFLPSPYSVGTNYHGGKSYEMRLTMNEYHLLPLPYQTNCTDYLKLWRENGGRGPINQLGIVQECKMQKWYKTVGCVSVKVDYPHNYRICGAAVSDNATIIAAVSEDECTMMAENYNQPCSSTTYITTKDERTITVSKTLNIRFLAKPEEFRKQIPGYDCTGSLVWTFECSKIDIEILFDRFEITNLTYNPKFESLEMFSVIGGYMGMWLGISLVTVYDFMGTILGYVKAWGVRKHQKRMKRKKDALLRSQSAIWNDKVRRRSPYYGQYW